MKSHFIRRFNYDNYANKQMAELLLQTNANGRPVEIMAHILAAQNVWLGRLKNIPPAQPVVLWPTWDMQQVLPFIDSNHEALTAHLETMQTEDFERVIGYNNSAGYFETMVTDILTHVINHGTHHRAQIGTLLKAEGANLPSLDYVFYLRTLNPPVK